MALARAVASLPVAAARAALVRRSHPGDEDQRHVHARGGDQADADLFASVGLGNENASRRTQVHKDAIKSVMETAGWVYKQGRVAGKQRRGWFKGSCKEIYRYYADDKKFTKDGQPVPVTLDAEIIE